MTGKRTGIDFSEHELIVTKTDEVLIHFLKVPGTVMDCIKYINTSGILAVTGDYSNWIFCREFHPTANGRADEHYWKGKLKIASCQKVENYDGEATYKEIQRMLDEDDLSEEDREDLKKLQSLADDELEYTYYAFRESKLNERWDLDYIPHEKKTLHHFLVILDGFDEICRRLKEKETTVAQNDSLKENVS